MPVAMSLTNATCRACGQDTLVWWYNDETETTIEVYVDCSSCRREYPKQLVDKREDTTRAALEEVVREVVR